MLLKIVILMLPQLLPFSASGPFHLGRPTPWEAVAQLLTLGVTQKSSLTDESISAHGCFLV
ncbi:hypothetical protein MPLB_430075 [Mesorhizobium sp. ORS 3324]|nr:hypothetical protein MPLB_430075 [Mesorhizobium sp. ORS 3324]